MIKFWANCSILGSVLTKRLIDGIGCICPKSVAGETTPGDCANNSIRDNKLFVESNSLLLLPSKILFLSSGGMNKI